MNLLVDANLSPRLVTLLEAAGVEATHVGERGLLQATGPSVIHLRGVAELTVEDHAQLLIANLPLIDEDLTRGAIASLSPHRLAVRDLPVR